jgi:predicted nucleotidyltransferase
MRTDRDHLPATKQRELERIVETIFEEFRAATENADGRRKGARILKIVLFGSYARGDWVDAPLSVNQYKSDYDILIIVSQKELTDRVAYWAKAEERLIRAYTIEKTLQTPVNFIVHSVHEVNDGLAHGRVFFIEVSRTASHSTKPMTANWRRPSQRRRSRRSAAREYFEEHIVSSIEFLDNSKFNLEKGRRNNAAFQLHQATERLYQGLLLTLSFYTPYNHNIAFLRSLAEGLDRRLYGIWPESNRRERAMFQKLKAASVRCSRN